jgi:hypothetical protein
MLDLHQKYPHLKKRIQANSILSVRTGDYQPWTLENIADGFKKFFADEGRYPTADEVDAFDFLPTSRQIQRAFGGLRELRAKLNLHILDYGCGESRSKIAHEVNFRSNLGEREIERSLIEKFGEYFVHVEKLIKKGKSRADFVVYAKNYTFAVDVFHPRSLLNLKKIVNIKQDKYESISWDVYLVNLNPDNITDDSLAQAVQNKDKKLSSRIILINRKKFIQFISTLTPLSIAI